MGPAVSIKPEAFYVADAKWPQEATASTLKKILLKNPQFVAIFVRRLSEKWIVLAILLYHRVLPRSRTPIGTPVAS